MTPTRPQAVRRQTAPPSCARPGRVRDPSPHEPVPTRTLPTRTLNKEKRQARYLTRTRTNPAQLFSHRIERMSTVKIRAGYLFWVLPSRKGLFEAECADGEIAFGQ